MVAEEKGYPKILENYDPEADDFVRHPVYQLEVSMYLRRLDPTPEMAGFGLVSIDPIDYYVTSGDAVQKTTYLSRILWAYAGKARKVLSELEHPSQESVEFEQECWKQAGNAQRLLNLLIKVRGHDVFLETEWNQHQLLCIPKNPRSKGEVIE